MSVMLCQHRHAKQQQSCTNAKLTLNCCEPAEFHAKEKRILKHKKARSHSTLTNLVNYSNKQRGIVCYTRAEKCVAASEKHKNAATVARAATAPVNNVSSQVLQDGGVLMLVICLRNQPLCTEGGECLQPVLNRSCLSQRGPLNLVRSKMIL